MVSTLVLPFSGLDGIELGFLRQQNEVTIDTCDIHQIEENAEVKSKDDFPSKQYVAVHRSIRSTPAMPLL